MMGMCCPKHGDLVTICPVCEPCEHPTCAAHVARIRELEEIEFHAEKQLSEFRTELKTLQSRLALAEKVAEAAKGIVSAWDGAGGYSSDACNYLRAAIAKVEEGK